MKPELTATHCYQLESSARRKAARLANDIVKDDRVEIDLQVVHKRCNLTRLIAVHAARSAHAVILHTSLQSSAFFVIE